MSTKSLGQHFLKNKSAIHKVVAALELAQNDAIIEIGPGHGELTRQMASGPSTPLGAGKWQVVAIEKDEKLFQALNSSKIENLKVVHGDALEILPEIITQLPNYPIDGKLLFSVVPAKAGIHASHKTIPGSSKNWKLVGNLPYYITGHLLRIVSELPESEKPERCVFMIQKEVAERIVAKPPEMNRLAASVGYWADAKIIAILSKEDFAPQPKVMSAIILLTRKAKPAFGDASRYYEGVRTLFAQPRKTVLNNLVAHEDKTEKETLSAKLHSLNINPSARPQDLSVETIAEIAKLFF